MRTVLLCVLALAGCRDPEDVEPPGSDDPYADDPGPLDATVRWTSHGVPHVEATSWASLGYGAGYAFAEENACILADQILKTKGERARWFGPDFVDADFGWRHLGPQRYAEEGWFELDERLRDLLMGYALGYNRVVEDGNLGPDCAGQPWVQPISHIDLLGYLLGFGLDGSGAIFASVIGASVPPNASLDGVEAASPTAAPPSLEELMAPVLDPARGSNGWALGSERTASGKGALLSNTHFPYQGEKRWFEWHHTIPGVLDVYGASLMGVPMVNIGFNNHVAWTHTVSYAPRFTVYRMSLDPSSPTAYRFGDEVRDMEPTTYEIEVLDGERVRTRRRTLYRTHFGPVVAQAPIGWTDAITLSARDANENNLNMLDAWFDMNLATSMEELQAAHTAQGIPWVYTLASSAEGEAWFADSSRTPNLSDATWAAWAASGDPITRQFANSGAVLLPGDDPSAEWVEVPGTGVPGVLPLDAAPQDLRRDAMFNANDDPWIYRPDGTLDDFLPNFGTPRSPISGRTRMNAKLLSSDDPASGDDGLFTLEELEGAAMGMRSLYTELALDAVVARCESVGMVTLGEDDDVDISDACDVLAAWDGTFTADAVGAILWREFLASGEFNINALNRSGGDFFAVPFDPDDPFNTPHTLIAAPDEGDDPVLVALAKAVQQLDDVGIGLSDPLSDWQKWAPPSGLSDQGIPGAGYWEGTIGISDFGGGSSTLYGRYFPPNGWVNGPSNLTRQGYPITVGNSWVMAMHFTDDGPKARAVMVYSQSTNPDSPFYDDQVSVYGAGELRDVAFSETEIAADTQRTETISR